MEGGSPVLYTYAYHYADIYSSGTRYWVVNDATVSAKLREKACAVMESYLIRNNDDSSDSAVWYSRGITKNRRIRVEIVRPERDLRWKALQRGFERAGNIAFVDPAAAHAAPYLLELGRSDKSICYKRFVEVLEKHPSFMRMAAPVIDEYLAFSWKIFDQLHRITTESTKDELRQMSEQLALTTATERLEPLAKLTVAQRLREATDHADHQAGNATGAQFLEREIARNDTITVDLLRDELAPFLK